MAQSQFVDNSHISVVRAGSPKHTMHSIYTYSNAHFKGKLMGYNITTKNIWQMGLEKA